MKTTTFRRKGCLIWHVIAGRTFGFRVTSVFYGGACAWTLAGLVWLGAAIQGFSVDCVLAPTGVVGWWPGENNADDLVGGDHGALDNGVGFVAGMVGQAFSFNGTNSYVEVPDSPVLRLTNDLTIEFWVKRHRLNGIEVIIEKGGDWTGAQCSTSGQRALADSDPGDGVGARRSRALRRLPTAMGPGSRGDVE
jgi:hypothetical protein